VAGGGEWSLTSGRSVDRRPGYRAIWPAVMMTDVTADPIDSQQQQQQQRHKLIVVRH